MKSTDSTNLIETVIASGAASGYVTTIPDTQATAGDGTISLTLGSPPECSISVAAGGKRPLMKDVNGVYKLLSAGIQSLQSWGILPYSADFSSAIDGYPLGAVVQNGAGGGFYVSQEDDNTTAPSASSTTWQSLFTGYISGTLGVISSNGDEDGLGLHLNGSTLRASFIYGSSSSGDLAWYADVTTEATARAAADKTLQADINTRVSGTFGVVTANGDVAVTGLHINGATNRPSVVRSGASGDVAWYSDVTTEAAAREKADAALQTDVDACVSGTLGVVDGNGDKDGTGLHFDGSTGQPSFVYDGGSGNLAWKSDVTSEASARKDADTTLQNNINNCVSGTLGVVASDNDKQGTGLHFDGATGNPSFVYDGGSGDLAWQSTLTAEVTAREAATSTLQTNIDTCVSGTLGVLSSDNDKQGLGLHLDGATGNPSFAYDGGTGDIAWQSTVTAEVTRAKAAEATAVSGTLGVISSNGDKDGTGLHYDGATGNPSFSYDGGSGDVAWKSDVTSEASAREAADETLQTDIDTRVSGTLGVVSSNGDIAATGLHVDGATGHANVVTDSETLDLTSYSGFAVAPTLYTGSTTITVPKGVSIALIKAIGGGGSGCSCEGSSLSTSSYGAGGAAGGYVYFSIAVSNGDTIDLTIGAGASSPTNTVNGQTNGGDTIVTHNGTEVARGSGGTGGVWSTASSSAGGTGGGATTQNGANPIEYSNGTDGGDGQTGAESIASVTGYGAPGVWGGGGRAGNGGGQAGTGFGAGGGGAYDTSYSSTFYGGGAGHAGCVTVEFK